MAKEAPTSIFSVLAALEANGAPGLLERELETALAAGLITNVESDLLRRVESNLVRGRRRESLLRVLLETATDLVGITDFEAMLQAIVRRTRMLLGSDMAYISLNDYDKRETFIHTTDGVATEAYRNIRMELGTGVLGKIAEGTGSSQTIDYIGDPDFIHVSEIDKIVQQEGVRTLMGAPLLRDGVLLGALLVGDRYQRRYSDEEVWLVDSMSTLACVALSNARLIGDLKNALAERDVFQARLEGKQRQLAEEQAFERALVDCAVSDDPYGRFLETLVAQHHGEVWLIDDLGRPLRGVGDLPMSEAAVEKALTRAHRSGEVEVLTRAAVATQRAETMFMLLPVGVPARLLGGVLMAGELTPEAEWLLRRSAVMLSVLRLMDESSREESVKVQTELVHALFMGSTDQDYHLLGRAARLGIKPGQSLHVHLVAAEASSAVIIDALRSHPSWEITAVAEFGGHVALLHDDNVGESVVQVLARKQIPATVAVERVDAFAGSLGSCYENASATLAAMLALELTNQAATSAELGTVGMLMTSATPAQVQSIISVELAPLIEYDEYRGTELIDTLWAFFGADKHQVRAAEQLHVHPNTLRQRLERVSALLGEDWHTARRSSMIYVALQLLRLSAARN